MNSVLLFFWTFEKKEKTMSDVLSNNDVGIDFRQSIFVQVDRLITYANLNQVEVIRITPSGEVFLDGERHGELNYFRAEDVMIVFKFLYRLAGMSSGGEPPYVGECRWPTEEPVTRIKVACVPIDPMTVEVVLRFVGL